MKLNNPAGVLCRSAGALDWGQQRQSAPAPEQWLIIGWPAGQAGPEKYYLSRLPETALSDLVRAAHMRWRIERDYLDLKQNLD
jgi:SRSO17 transposase